MSADYALFFLITADALHICDQNPTPASQFSLFEILRLSSSPLLSLSYAGLRRTGRAEDGLAGIKKPLQLSCSGLY